MTDYSAAAHCAHTFSRLSVGYARMAKQFPSDGPYFMACSRDKRRQARRWLSIARMWRAEQESAEAARCDCWDNHEFADVTEHSCHCCMNNHFADPVDEENERLRVSGVFVSPPVAA